MTSGKELFRSNAVPKQKSSRFSHPTIQKPQISVKNGTVQIVLCQTKYYDYIVKRENEGKFTIIYQGNYQQTICDNSVRSGETYVYTVIPVYQKTEGAPVTLPPVHIQSQTDLPDRWWE